MSHSHTIPVNINEVVKAGPLQVSAKANVKLWLMVFVGIIVMTVGLLGGFAAHVWASFYVSFVFFMGLAMGGVMISVIFQIVRARWSPPIRRLAESNVSFLPIAFVAFLSTYFGREYLFVWAREPMPGREWWMQPGFVYVRFAILFAVLFLVMTRFVHLSLRGDLGLARERDPESAWWHAPIHNLLLSNWRGAEREVIPLQRRMSYLGPVVVLCYAVVYSLFAFEMIVGMNEAWSSNLFGAFIFVSSIYIGWGGLTLLTVWYSKHFPKFGRFVSTQQLWDLGKLTFGFCMLWGYMFWSQFLTQWYGNLPEETQWMILRTREYPWINLAYVAFGMSFIIPYICLLSRDVKKTPWAHSLVALVLMTGVWLDRYMIIVPEVSPDHVPLFVAPWIDIGIFLGFLGAYLLCVTNFLSKHPFVPISHPMTHGSVDW